MVPKRQEFTSHFFVSRSNKRTLSGFQSPRLGLLRPRRRQPLTAHNLGDETPRRPWWEASVCQAGMADALGCFSITQPWRCGHGQGLGVALPFLVSNRVIYFHPNAKRW